MIFFFWLQCFFPPHMNSNGCKLLSLGRRGEEVIMTNYPFCNLSLALSLSNCSSNTAACKPCSAFPFECYLYLLDQTSTFAYLSLFRGCNGELYRFQSFSSESLVIMSLNICKDNAFHSHFNLNLSIIMIEGDSLSFTCEGMGHFSNLHVASNYL